MKKLLLPDVTLCAASSVNVEQTISAIRQCQAGITFGRSILLTDLHCPHASTEMEVVKIAPLRSGAAYSSFIIEQLPDHIDTGFVLLVQWDGFIINPELWDARFCDYDYIGASWPQFQDGCSVGNGGFSLRSRALLQACKDPEFRGSHPEDVAICRENRTLLEKKFSLKFAEPALADNFSFERLKPDKPTFGFHGAFNMVQTMGSASFWDAYQTLDDKGSLFTDFWAIMWDAIKHGGQAGWPRTLRMIATFSKDYMRHRRGITPTRPGKS
ncbi:hypothetical protein KFK14_14905 [Sphingobium phenoxybenzoativorans]|uniref:DUF5672 domain-containing protein n=1 Tax=Sphingobium phenoxybenzoativorans TaxID=1592790 RepID=A0A975K4H3_9SPHN|nr:DUF5672 family protein [Sphingobium phenoxybenzoativorans]QUT04352.1 hypothetical protein KFK14_14905 [Sphingobium phenoxybenzoativorans]